ncbi:hypothetical protein REPUB_Repub15cG0085100 [Reevesia pubescens]
MRTSCLQLIHSLVDRLMEVMGTHFVPVADSTGYYVELSDEPEFLSGRQAKIIYKERCIGVFGIVHPEFLLQISELLMKETSDQVGDVLLRPDLVNF